MCADYYSFHVPFEPMWFPERNGSHRLAYLNTWFAGCATVWQGLRGLISPGSVSMGAGFEVFKSHGISS